MNIKDNPLMPKIGSRAHRVLVELARCLAPVKEDTLMAAHGLDDLAPTIWRQGPYKSLQSSGLVDLCGAGWHLTALGRQLMDQVEAEMLRGAPPAPAPEPSMAVPRIHKPFTPMTVRQVQRPIREGAFDYRDIPSLHSDSRTKEPS